MTTTNTPRKLLALLATNNRGLTAEQMSGLTAEQMSWLTAEQMSGLTAEQMSWLTARQMSWLTARQMSWLTAEQMSGLTARQMSWLTAEQMSGLTAEQMSWLTAEQMSWLTAEQMSGLTAEQMSGLTAEQMSWLTARQMSGLGSKARAFVKAALDDLDKIVPRVEKPYTRMLEGIRAGLRVHKQSTFGPDCDPETNLCKTPMCTAGHLVNMGGAMGYALKQQFGWETAALLIHRKARPDVPPQDFGGIPQEWAMAYIEERAEEEAQ